MANSPNPQQDAATFAEHVLKKIEGTKNFRKEVYEEYKPLIVASVREYRSWVIQFSLLSSAIVGFSIPILDKLTLIKTGDLFKIGLGVLLLVAMGGLAYVKRTLEKELKDLDQNRKEYFDLLDKSIEADKEFLKSIVGNNKVLPAARKKWEETLNTLAKPLQDKIKESKTAEPKMNYTTDLLFALFLLGIFLLLISTVVAL